MDANIITTVATGLGILTGVYAIVNKTEDRINKRMDDRFTAVGQRFSDSDRVGQERFNALNTRFNDMKDLWRAELHRVEEILDARLKHLEEHVK
jgi:hypothetical protein